MVHGQVFATRSREAAGQGLLSFGEVIQGVVDLEVVTVASKGDVAGLMVEVLTGPDEALLDGQTLGFVRGRRVTVVEVAVVPQAMATYWAGCPDDGSRRTCISFSVSLSMVPRVPLRPPIPASLRKRLPARLESWPRTSFGLNRAVLGPDGL